MFIQLPCGPIPATVPGIGPKATKTTQNMHQKLSKHHQKLKPGGVPEPLGGGLGTILAPKGASDVPRDARTRKSLKTENLGPPPGAQVGDTI